MSYRNHCVACGSGDWRNVARSLYGETTVRIVICRRCNTIYTQNPDDQSLFVSSPELFQGKMEWEAADHKLAAYKKAVELIRSTLQKEGVNLLDFGCGSGEFLAYCKQGGIFQAVGLDPSEAQRGKAARRGQVVLSPETLDWQTPAFDVVTMWDVIEHLRDPARELVSIRKIMRPSAILLVSCPSAEGARLKLQLGPAMVSKLEPHEHVQYLSVKGMVSLLANCGYSSIVVTRCPAYRRRTASAKEVVRRLLWPFVNMQHLVVARRDER